MVIQDLGQFPIFGGYGMAGIVGRESNHNTVVNIGPFGMVPQFFNGWGGLMHEMYRIRKSLEFISLLQRIVGLGPGWGVLGHKLGI
jgi:hypothetical protein